MSKCGCDILKVLGIVIIGPEAEKIPPTHNDHVKTEGFETTTNKNMPDVQGTGTQTIRNPDA